MAGGVVTLLVSAGIVALTAAPAAAVDPLPNPQIPAQCGLGVTLVLDASGSVQSSNAVGAVRTAAEAFLEAFQDTGSTARVTQFASLSQELAPRTIVDAASMQPGGLFREAINRYYNPIPPRPSDVEIKRFNNGNASSPGSWQSANSSNQYTNWDQSLRQVAAGPGGPGDLVVYITDGDPTAYDFNRAGDPFSPGPPPDVGVGTDKTSAVATITLDRAVERANQVKAAKGRVLAIGVGSALQNQASVDRLTKISGPNVARSIADFDVETTDVALIPDFDDLAQAVRALVLDLCSPSLTIRKFAQSATDASYQPVPGWDMTVTPTVSGGFDWVLPAGATPPSATVTTGSAGFAQFQWEPTNADATSDALVEEALTPHPDYTPGRPGDANDFRCEFKNAAGDTRVVTGELTDAGATASFDLTGIGNEIGTCSVYNSFDYAPDIAITKVNTPSSVRADLTPPAVVRSDFTVTNPGNTPLAHVTVADDRCAPVQAAPAAAPNDAFNVGDLNRNNLLETPETWAFFCDRAARASAGNIGPVNVVNTATALGTDPGGAVVTATATDDVDAFVPRIQLTKLVNGQDAVTVAAGTAVTYTYEVVNTGSTPLQPVTLADDTAPCESPTLTPPADGDTVLAVGETWNYTCTASPTASVLNTATVSGVPIDPTTGLAFPDPNPPVTDVDTAQVSTIDPDLTLTKSVDQSLVFPGTSVAYSYAAANTGTADLRNDTGAPGWVADDSCSPVAPVLAGAFNTGDANTDNLLNPGETWNFSCAAVITAPTLNIATIVAQPVAAGTPTGPPLTRHDIAFVDVVDPGIAIVKTALVPVVLDPDATPFSGPDFPDPRPAAYSYQVSNTGTVPLREVAPTDDRCATIDFVSGDVNADGILDVGEVWNYLCETTGLQREQGTPPPLGAESGNVINTVTVTGVPFLPTDPTATGPTQTATAVAQVLAIQPGIAITKTASAPVVQANGLVTYTVAITNTGDVGLEVIGPIDDKCALVPVDENGDGIIDGDQAPGHLSPGNGILDGANTASAETWTYTCTRVIGLPPAPDTTDVNTASVVGVDTLGNSYEAQASAEVRVIDPAIDLVKTVSDNLVLTGSEVTYTFEVTNVGTSPVVADDVLADVALNDVAVPSLPTCSTPTFVGGDDNGNGLLDRDPGEVWSYECNAVITAPTTNLAGVEGIGGTTFGLQLPVFAFDAQFVQTFNPAIEVVKTATPTQTTPGGEVTYTYDVRNTGDVPLAGVADRITDDTCSPVQYLSGDQDADGLLDTPKSIFEDAADETWRFQCTTTFDETTKNTVVVEGTPTGPLGAHLCDDVGGAGPGVAALAVTTCDPTDLDIATVTVVPPLAPTGGQVMWPLLALGTLLIAIGAAAVAAARRSARSLG
ncbi:DUF7507 domain-containing protein [Microbacterium deminutum]|uniref:VWFA domain-containing protein n=1 Tax=Microbacterium deminutum TaxID=344164 RepID=A0ABN2QIJ2_9MICO